MARTLQEKQAEISRRKIALGQEIGPLPAVADAERREENLSDFYRFAEFYFPELFPDPFSRNHCGNIDVIVRTRGSLRHVFNLPRRWGKTTTMTIVILYLILRSDISFAYIVAANEEMAEEILEAIRVELESNANLLADFPDVCWPFHALESRASRSLGQKLDGKRTHIKINTGQIRFPVVEGSPCSGAIIKACGIGSKQLGTRVRTKEGAVRPDFILLDDIQDEESSSSFSQTEKIKKKVQKTLKYLTDKKKPCKIVINCTVRNRDDLADTYLNDPRWTGKRCGALDEIPKDLTPWRAYAEEQERLLDQHRDVFPPETKESLLRNGLNAYYKAHCETLEAGFKAHWEYAKTPVHLTPVQAVMENWIEDETSFWSEDMNRPLAELLQDTDDLDIDTIMSKRLPFQQYWIPRDTEAVVAAIDIHNEMLSYLVLAGGESFSTHVCDYGVFPKQPNRSVVQPESVPKKISDVFQNMETEDAVYEAINALVAELMKRTYTREDGVERRIVRIFIDAKYGPLTPTVRKYCKNTGYPDVVLHSFSANEDIYNAKKKIGEKRDSGGKWVIPPPANYGDVRHVLYDGNHWKSFALARIQSSAGNKSSLTIYSGDKSHHAQLIADWTAEQHEKVYTKTKNRDTIQTKWKDKPGRKNRSHLWDCLTMCFVALSEQGFALDSQEKVKTKLKKEKKKLSGRRNTGDGEFGGFGGGFDMGFDFDMGGF
ncbi:MAG: phage terminase large subunit family protein [Planctomycetaceae bacterium]|jgi:hypothetical protein|nr:phage terminase large subunit family protein [Planctomycetaceae bacterium]